MGALNKASLALSGLLILTAGAALAGAQAVPTAAQTLQLSAWGGATGAYTGLENSHDLGISIGVDLGLRSYFHVFPSLEVRGTFPIDDGSVVGEKSGLIGLKFAKPYGRIKPYVDILFGRGQLNYVNPLPNSTFTYYYLQTTSNVLSPGAGIDFQVTHHFDLKADGQFQRWATPVAAGGHITPTPITAAIVYNFDFNGRRHFPTR